MWRFGITWHALAALVFTGFVIARIVRRRFDEHTAERLAALAWWNWSHEALRRALPDFRKLGVDVFLDKYERANGE